MPDDGTTNKHREVGGTATIQRLFENLGKADNIKTMALATALIESFMNGMLLQERLSTIANGGDDYGSKKCKKTR